MSALSARTVVAELASEMDTSARTVLANTLYDLASKHWDIAEKRRERNRLYRNSKSRILKDAERYHRNLWRAYRDHAEYVSSLIPHHVYH